MVKVLPRGNKMFLTTEPSTLEAAKWSVAVAKARYHGIIVILLLLLDGIHHLLGRLSLLWPNSLWYRFVGAWFSCCWWISLVVGVLLNDCKIPIFLLWTIHLIFCWTCWLLRLSRYRHCCCIIERWSIRCWMACLWQSQRNCLIYHFFSRLGRFGIAGIALVFVITACQQLSLGFSTVVAPQWLTRCLLGFGLSWHGNTWCYGI